MRAFSKLLEVVDKLLAPGGCSWDREQTLQSIRPYLLEEAYEALEAVDEDDTEKMVEELGDLFYVLVFYGRLGEKYSRFTLEEMIEKQQEKLVRRHPHVFGDVKVSNTEELYKLWEKIKQKEKKERKSPLEGIPMALNALARAQKIIDKMERKKIPLPSKGSNGIGDELLDLVIKAQKEGVDAESALRETLKKVEKSFDEEIKKVSP